MQNGNQCSAFNGGGVGATCPRKGSRSPSGHQAVQLNEGISSVSQRATTAASQWCHSGITVVPHHQHPLVKIYRGSCQNLSKYKKHRCDAVVMRWSHTGDTVVTQWWGCAATLRQRRGGEGAGQRKEGREEERGGERDGRTVGRRRISRLMFHRSHRQDFTYSRLRPTLQVDHARLVSSLMTAFTSIIVPTARLTDVYRACHVAKLGHTTQGIIN